MAVVGRGQPVGSRRAVLCPPHLKETRSSQHLKLTSLRHFVTAVTGDQYVTKKIISIFMCVHTQTCLRRPEEGGSGPPCECWELSLGPLSRLSSLSTLFFCDRSQLELEFADTATVAHHPGCPGIFYFHLLRLEFQGSCHKYLTFIWQHLLPCHVSLPRHPSFICLVARG